MKSCITILISILFIVPVISFGIDQPIKIIKLEGKEIESGFEYPTLELKGRVAEIFSFYDAEYISGLTCRIKFNGKKPLPNKVFFSEYDNENKEISHKVRLIYPRMKSGESGYATFRITCHPQKIVIWSEGDGPWESPY